MCSVLAEAFVKLELHTKLEFGKRGLLPVSSFAFENRSPKVLLVEAKWRMLKLKRPITRLTVQPDCNAVLGCGSRVSSQAGELCTTRGSTFGVLLDLASSTRRKRTDSVRFECDSRRSS